MDTIRIGIIGLGIMGKQYARVFAEHPLSTLVAVCARRPEQVEEFRKTYNAAGYIDHREMLERSDLDAIIIATPDAHHFVFTLDALESGRHVLVEKPFTTSTAQADELNRIALRRKRKIQVAFNHRWLSAYYQTRKSIAAGEIGAPLAGYSRKNDTIHVATKHISWADSTTSAWFLSSHDIDLMRWWLDSEPVEARAWGRQEVLIKMGIPTYDIIQAQVKFASGAFITFESGWIYPNTFPSTVDSFMEVIGTSGHVHLDRKRESIEISTGTKFSYPKGFLIADVFGRLRGAFPACLEDFLLAIRNDTEPHVTGVDGRQVTAVLEAIHESLRTGGSVAVPPLPDYASARQE